MVANGTKKAVGSTAIKAKPVTVRFTLDCTVAVRDNIIDPAKMEKFFHDRVKVDNKTNNLGTKVQISRDGKNKIVIVAEMPFSKRYIKYLGKKYMKREQVRDFLRIVATSKTGYELRYLAMNNEGEADE